MGGDWQQPSQVYHMDLQVFFAVGSTASALEF